MEQALNPLLEEKKIPDPFIPYSSDLLKVYNGEAAGGILGRIFSRSQDKSLLTKENAELGLLLINHHPTHKDSYYEFQNLESPKFQGERYLAIMRLTEDDWNGTSSFNLLVYFFGEQVAGYVRHAWQQMPNQMYQTGYGRRSFRSPGDRPIYFQRQIEFIICALRKPFRQVYEKGANFQYFDLDLIGQIRYNHLIGDNNPGIFRVWSSAIDLGNREVLQVMEDIVFNKDAEGKVTRSIIKALLNSQQPEAWIVVEKLLLAAQRQEGLRQTVVEAMDETSIGALKYFIRVIIDHDLVRFSSVVRSLDVWAGLGWHSEKEATVRSFLQKASHYLEHIEDIPAAVRSDNNADVYMALWAQAVYDVEKTLPYLQELCKNGNVEKRTLAVFFAAQTGHYKIKMPLYYAILDKDELPPLTVMAPEIELMGNSSFGYYNERYPDLFERLHALYQRVTVKEKTFEGYMFSWFKPVFHRKELLKALLAFVGDVPQRLHVLTGYLEDMDSDVKNLLCKKILPDFTGWRYPGEKIERKPLTEQQRSFALLMLKDRSEFDVGFKALELEVFSKEELAPFADWLKRKGAGFRSKILTILLRQDTEKLIPIIGQLLKGDGEQRMAGLDMLLQLNNQRKLPSQAMEWIEEFRKRKVSPKEEILLSQLSEHVETMDISAANGYGIYDPLKCAAVVDPATDQDSFYERLMARQPYGLSMPMSRIKEAMSDLGELIEQHAHYEYVAENYINVREKVLLGNSFRQQSHNKKYSSREELYQSFPLPEVWSEWHTKWKFAPGDIWILFMGLGSDAKIYRDQLPGSREFVPEKFLERLSYDLPFSGILRALAAYYPMAQADEYLVGAIERLFASLGEDELKGIPKERYYSSVGNGWQFNHSYREFTDEIDWVKMDAKLLSRLWNLYNWRQFSGLEENVARAMPPLILFCRAYEAGIIKKDDMLRGLLNKEHLSDLTRKQKYARDYDFFGQFGFLRELFDGVKNHILDIELKRGDTPTPVSPLAGSLMTIYGIGRLTQILAGLGKTNLRKGWYTYGTSGAEKQELFSALLKNCDPLETDTQEAFDAAMKSIKVTEQRLIEAAMYAPQWLRFVSAHLGWRGLDTAIWWMHAHTKTDGYQAQTAEAESEIARYSSLDVQEFKQGAVDKDWFWKAFNEIGKDRWPMVYDAAKYITDGNGHRRARIYADVLVGNLSLKDVTEKIGDKRDQDYVRIYGLAPLSKSRPEKDILERYEFIQAFKKGSRQFGALKQASEAAAVTVAMDNLARNAGYPDPIRLVWAMETQHVQSILSKETQVQYDDVLIGLIIDEEGQADVVAFKGDKQLSSIPAKYKKDAKVEELNGFKKTLREQFRRSKKGLEEAMVRGDRFQLTEIVHLMSHPVIARHLEKLIFVIDGREGHGFYKDGGLVADDGQIISLTEGDSLRIAHCTDLHHNRSWAGYQRLAFDRKLEQPFKQIFRELYLPTPDEQQEGSVSRRYAGHQIQPKQTVALLRGRGWKVNYEEGLQKVFHKEGFAAQMHAMADWFSPADIENPTLETVSFTDLKTYKNVLFSSIHPRIFSEVMRDLDLVVSVAHAGGVDPEASHSSIEMRAALLRETARLFKLNNVTIEGSHALIKGTLGEYSVHLGSAVVHRVLSGYVSILPVHSQHRGRIFLPFVDDDPRSAELLSKVLMLARDQEIKDPLILQQLK